MDAWRAFRQAVGMRDWDEAVFRTGATYADASGAARYAERDASVGAARDASAWSLIDDLDLGGMRALDVGCGPGRDVAEMRRRGAFAWGMDASGPLLAEARRRHGGDWWVKADMTRGRPWPVCDGLDLVWSQASLVHVPIERTGGVLGLWASWLRPGGRIAIATKEGDGQVLDHSLGDGFPRLMAYRGLDDLAGCLETLGLRIETARGGIPGQGTQDTFVAVRAVLPGPCPPRLPSAPRG